MRFEAEGCDYFGNANGGNGKVNFYRNGNIAIEYTTDAGGGHDIGWMQTNEWFEWKEVPLNGTPSFQVRIATTNATRTAHLEIDGVAQPSQTLPNTGGNQVWQTYDFGSYGSYTTSVHTVRFVFDNGGVNFNWWQTFGGLQVTNPPPPANLAFGKPVTASSSSSQYPAVNATDGDTTTRWQANATDNEWIYVNLGATYSITNVTFRWENAYASSYKIQVSTNASAWTDAYSTTNSDGQVDMVGVSGVGKYVRMFGVKRATIYGYSMYEFEVNGSLVGAPTNPPAIPTNVVAVAGNGQAMLNWTGSSDAASYNVKRSLVSGGTYTNIANPATTTYNDTGLVNDTTYYYVVSAANIIGESSNSVQVSATPLVTSGVNLALNQPVTASSTSDSTIAASAVDGNASTRWSSAHSDPQCIFVDLGATYSITEVAIIWESAYAVAYQIQVSSDAVNWTNIYSTATGTGGTNDLIGLSGTGRYVRIYGTKRAFIGGVQYGYSLYEFKVFGNVPTPPVPPANLTATTVSSNQINLAWNASSGATGYNLKRALVSGGAYTNIAVNLPGLAYTNTGLATGTIYYYVVTATNSFGESANSAEASAQTVPLRGR